MNGQLISGTLVTGLLNLWSHTLSWILLSPMVSSSMKKRSQEAQDDLCWDIYFTWPRRIETLSIQWIIQMPSLFWSSIPLWSVLIPLIYWPSSPSNATWRGDSRSAQITLTFILVRLKLQNLIVENSFTSHRSTHPELYRTLIFNINYLVSLQVSLYDCVRP